MAGIAIELGIAVDRHVLARIEQRPGGRGKADTTYVEVVDPGATLRENPVDPWQSALVGERINAG